MKLTFTKMQGLGNDFIFLDATKKKIPLKPSVIRRLCHRTLGVGADQLLLVSKSRKADFKMAIYNADGGEVEMCGNGLRSLARWVRDKRLSSKKVITVETKPGIQEVKIVSPKRIQVDMGPPILKGKQIPVNLNGRVINRPLRIDGRDVRITCVSVGNPHCVLFVDNVDNFPVTTLGPLLESHNLFPKRINVEFVEPLDKKTVKVRVWERGAGETLACGSGACAVAVAGVLNRYCDRKVTVKLPGGPLDILWDIKTDHVLMTGGAEKVFEGSVVI